LIINKLKPLFFKLKRKHSLSFRMEWGWS